MTGFGRGESRGKEIGAHVEIRSVNHRYLETSFRLPEGFGITEEPLRALVQKKARRGKVTVTVGVRGKPETQVQVHLETARGYLKGLRSLQKSLGLKGEISVEKIATLPGVFTDDDKPIADASAHVLKLAQQALEQWDKSRRREGEATRVALAKMVQGLEAGCKQLQLRAPQVVEEYRVRLNERIQSLTTQPLDPGRMEQEVAFFAKECDIAEEITRIQAHVAHLKTLLVSREPVGRTLDFVAQELQREVNTVGSKSSDVEVTRIAIQMKGWVEQLREQAQNVE